MKIETKNNVKELVEFIEQAICYKVMPENHRKLLKDCKAELERLEAENGRLTYALISITSIIDTISMVKTAKKALEQLPEGVINGGNIEESSWLVAKGEIFKGV